jgi:predicted RNA-binding Zn ribbon-like protein
MSEDVSKHAPGDLDLVRRFVNTFDVEDGSEDFPTPAALGRWLRAEGLPARGLTAADVERAHRLREALRDVLSTHNGADPAPEAIATLNELGATLSVTFDATGAASLHGADFASHILAIVARAQAEGTWERMKACAMESCRFAFYDRSRNRSGHWCDMAICGNRAKARNYRKRTS